MRIRLASFIALLACFAPALAPAEGISPQRDFTFRRVKVGEETAGRRITVQIDPEEQARVLAAMPKAPAPSDPVALPPVTADQPRRPLGPVPGQAARFSWFWDMVPSGADEASGRFEAALTALARGPQGEVVPAPRLQAMQALADAHGQALLRATVGTEVSPALALAVIAVESSGRTDAVSSAGAQGLMQLIPATAERFGVEDAMDPRQNIEGGVAYLDWLMKEFDRDPILVLAAYNAGEGAVRANRGVPPYAETRDYVPKVLAAWQVAQGLCATPPIVVTDPCVFRIIAAGN